MIAPFEINDINKIGFNQLSVLNITFVLKKVVKSKT